MTGDDEAQAPKRAKPASARSAGDTNKVREDRLGDERESQEREFVDDAELSEAERLELLTNLLTDQSVLPELPRIRGYHLFWASTTNKRDSIHHRLRLGYKPVFASEISGWEGASTKIGDFAGVVCVDEMVAMKLPLTLYNLYMRKLHHDLPLAEEQKLKANTASLADQAERVGGRIIEGEGNAELAQRARPMPEYQW